MSGIGHVYLGSADGLAPCGFRYAGSETDLCGYIRNNTIHLDAGGMDVRTSDAVTEIFSLGGEEAAVPRAHARAREAGNELVDGGGRSFAEEPAWRVAAAALVTDRGRVVGGPWPVRKLLFADSTGGDDREHYLELLGALHLVGIEYNVSVWRPVGAVYRTAFVQWGWATMLTAEAIADELALIYDRTVAR